MEQNTNNVNQDIENTPRKDICPLHNMELPLRTAYIPKRDENGEDIMDDKDSPVMEEIMFYDECPECETERYEKDGDRFYSSSPYDAMDILESETAEIKKRNPNEKTYAEKGRTDNFLDKYPPRIQEFVNAPLDACIGAHQFLISNALANAKYANAKGPIPANLYFMQIAPPGVNKSPLIKSTINRIMPSVFPEFDRFGQITPKGFLDAIKVKKNDEKQSGSSSLLLCDLVWDEVSTQSKANRNNGTNDMYETLSEMFDGELDSYSSVRGGRQKFPPVYISTWMSGMGGFLKYTSEEFFYQGFAQRVFFLSADKVKPRTIPRMERDNINEMYEEMENDLKLMKRIRDVEATDEFLDKYDEYQLKIDTEIYDLDSGIIKSQDPECYPILSKVKFPVLVMKLSMIYATARYNFTESGILKLEPVDLDKAIESLEIYHNNLMVVFRAWQELTEPQSKIDNVKIAMDKIKRNIESLITEGKGCSYDTVETRDKTTGMVIEKTFVFHLDPEGTWISHSSLLKKTHLSSDYMSRIVQTMTESFIMNVRDGVVKTKGKVNYPSKFYSLR